jgi:putative endopeptidase
VKRLVKPLSAAIALCLSFGAAASYTAFDVKELDAKTSPCADFDSFVNAKWVAANPIPADQVKWGAFNVLREKSLATQHEIAEDAAKGPRQGQGRIHRAAGRCVLQERHG